MENGAVYSPTTEENTGPSRRARSGLASWFTLGRLKRHRQVFKVLQLVLSLLAFISEEVVSQCTLCGGLYFFEFVSCSAFLLSLLLLIMYCTPVYEKVDAVKIKSSDYYITLGIGLVFFLASSIFISTHDKTAAEISAIVFGFIASLFFLLDFGIMLKERLASRLRKPEATTNTEAATQPLNS